MAMNNPDVLEKRHGIAERGLDTTPRSSLFEGRFGRIFRSLPPAQFSDAELRSLALEMSANKEAKVTPDTEIDDEENFGIPAGYTYLGQFIDHDITFDPLSSLVKQNDPGGLVDFRTPALDLDNLYGRGPAEQPYMYTPDGRFFALGRPLFGNDPSVELTRDLPRFNERALIGDKRNDENVIVSQLQGLFLRFHNLLATQHPDLSFGQVQQLVRWHYQWIVLFDFLPRIVGEPLVKNLLPHLHSHKSIHEDEPKLRFFKWKNDPFMPLEFSVAAYRFGHSMVRPVYRLSGLNLPNSKHVTGLEGRKAIFDPIDNDGLNGFREFPDSWGIDWHLFFETPGHTLADQRTGRDRVQPAYKIDTSLVSPLSHLPEFSTPPGSSNPVPDNLAILAERNLLRGVRLGLPSGQDVARFMGLDPIPDNELFVGKATAGDIKTNKLIRAFGKGFEGKAPLWYYILAEAQHQWAQDGASLTDDAAKNAVPVHLGPVGGRIVAEVLIGLIWGSKQSFLQVNQKWTPEFGDSANESVFQRFTMGDLVEAVMAAG